jgi:hypothetical protein
VHAVSLQLMGSSWIVDGCRRCGLASPPGIAVTPAPVAPVVAAPAASAPMEAVLKDVAMSAGPPASSELPSTVAASFPCVRGGPAAGLPFLRLGTLPVWNDGLQQAIEQKIRGLHINPGVIARGVLSSPVGGGDGSGSPLIVRTPSGGGGGGGAAGVGGGGGGGGAGGGVGAGAGGGAGAGAGAPFGGAAHVAAALSRKRGLEFANDEFVGSEDFRPRYALRTDSC